MRDHIHNGEYSYLLRTPSQKNGGQGLGGRDKSSSSVLEVDRQNSRHQNHPAAAGAGESRGKNKKKLRPYKPNIHLISKILSKAIHQQLASSACIFVYAENEITPHPRDAAAVIHITRLLLLLRNKQPWPSLPRLFIGVRTARV